MYVSYVTTSTNTQQELDVTVAERLAALVALGNDYFSYQLKIQLDQLQQREAVLWQEFYSTAHPDNLPLDQSPSISSAVIISQQDTDPSPQQPISQQDTDPSPQQPISQQDKPSGLLLSQEISQQERTIYEAPLYFDSSNRPFVPVQTDMGPSQYHLSVNSNLEVRINGHWFSGKIGFDHGTQHYYVVDKEMRKELTAGMKVRIFPE